jgi:hypothetical protein
MGKTVKKLFFQHVKTYKCKAMAHILQVVGFWHEEILTLVWANLMSCNFSLFVFLILLYIFQIYGVYLYNILRWLSFLSIRIVIHPVIHPSKFLIPEEEDDGRGGRMAAWAVYPNVYVIQSCSLWKTPVVLQFAKSYKLIF